MNKLLTHKTTKLTLISLSILGIIGVSFPFGLIENPVLAQSNINSIDTKKAEAERLFNEGSKLLEEGTVESLKEAVNNLQKALIVYQEIGDKPHEAVINLQLGRVYELLGLKQPEALNYYGKALSLFQQLEYPLGEATALNNTGIVYSDLGQKQKALDYLKQALSLRIAVGDRLGEANTLTGIGKVYSDLGQKQKALDYYQQALPLRRTVGDRSGEANTLNNIGAVYYTLGEYQKALDYFQQALTLSKVLNDLLGEASILSNIGGVYLDLGEYQEALDYFQQALPLRRTVGDRSGEATTLNNIGGVYDNLGEKQKALEYYQQSLPLSKAVGDRKQEAITLNNIGLVYDALGKKQKALEYYQQSLPLSQAVGDRTGEARTLGNMGLIFAQQNNFSEAEKYIFNSIEINEFINNKDLADSSKISFFDTYFSTYIILQKVLIQQNKILPALEVAERGRSAALKEELAKRLSTPEAPVTVEKPTIEQIRQTAKNQNATLVQYSIIRDQFDVDGKKEWQDSELYIWVIKPTGEIDFRSYNLKENNLDINQLVENARDDIDTLRVNNRGNNSTPSFTLKDFKTGDSLILQDDPPNNLPWTVISINSADNSLTLSHPSLEEGVTRKTPISNVKNKATETEANSLKQLYQVLIDPIADLLPTDPNEKVVFLPQESLFLLPFPALIDENNKYLIEKHTILTAPAIQVLESTYKQRQNRPSIREKPLKPQETLIVGNPIPMPDPMLPPLEYAQKEAEKIANLFNTQPILNNAATESNIVSKISDARLIHFATHGIFNQERAISSYIAFAPDPNFAKSSDNDNLIFPNNSDGFLIVEEIFDLKLNADLVILSACNTGQGEITGDGVIGLSRAFISAGASSIMVSLWAVNDESTATLMTQFYQNLNQNQDKAQALRKAMLTTIETNPDPYYWAAFTLIGNSE